MASRKEELSYACSEYEGKRSLWQVLRGINSLFALTPAFTYDVQGKVMPTFLLRKFYLIAVDSCARWRVSGAEGAGGSFGILVAMI